MTKEEKMLSFHRESLKHIHDEKTLKGFDEPIVENDSITSVNKLKKIAHITRHLLTCEATHSIILRDEWFNRL